MRRSNHLQSGEEVRSRKVTGMESSGQNPSGRILISLWIYLSNAIEQHGTGHE